MRPAYLSLGNEVNRWYERYGATPVDPNSFQNFVSLYEELYDRVKELSPDTVVFCTFAREMTGEYREAGLSVLELFDPDKLDMLVLTTYPFAVQGINKPSDIPAEYYSRAAAYFRDKPFGLSEAGWPALPALGGEAPQAEFLRDLVRRLTVEQGVELRLVGWPWLHSLDDGDYTSLVTAGGKEGEAYKVWQELSNRTN